MRHYSEEDLEGLVSLEAAIDGLARAFAEYAAGRALVQPRIPTELGALRISTMAAMIPAMGCCGAKVYTVFRGKFSFIILLFSAADGQLLATFDAGTLRVVELGALVTGAVPRRQSDAEITLFDSVGFALEDVAIASIAHARLVELGKI